MKINIIRLMCLGLITLGGSPFSATFSQEPDVPQFRSRAEQLAARRNLEKTYPEVVRALRSLHLPSDKIIEAETKLRRSEAATRVARQELQLLEEERERQGYSGRGTKSARADELRAGLQQSTDQLHAEIKSLLNPQQRAQLESHLKKRDLRKEKSNRSR